ncbi:MAG: hypothetical protein NZ805_14780 [Armatimonadetes bacterium]|nr:hypothetical protein [Armatimonadota bacterium]MDW8028888.1 hypothetical protein [Armatimonadota bacterium]
MKELLFLFVGLVLGLALTFAWRKLRFLLGRTLYGELKSFFKTDPRQLPIVSRSFMAIDLPNLHIAITEYAQERATNFRTVGYSLPSWSEEYF